MHVHRRRYTIEYFDDITERRDGVEQCLGKRLMRCEVEIELAEEDAAGYMGVRACRSKGGKCRDGPVTVKRIGTPVELSREVKS